jgi:putative endonuclease
VSTDSASTGRAGEELAARYLSRQGCSILARNWRAHTRRVPGEVDIIADCPASYPTGPAGLTPSGREIAFIEIRTRHGRPGLAEESISRRKATSMAAAAYAYMQSQDIDPEATPWRIDLIAISMSPSGLASINWIRGAIDETMLEAPQG